MILTMRFNMEDADDREKFNTMNDATSMSIALSDALEFIRGKLKHGQLSEETGRILEQLRDEIRENLSDCKTSF